MFLRVIQIQLDIRTQGLLTLPLMSISSRHRIRLRTCTDHLCRGENSATRPSDAESSRSSRSDWWLHWCLSFCGGQGHILLHLDSCLGIRCSSSHQLNLQDYSFYSWVWEVTKLVSIELSSTRLFGVVL